ncbi:MAG: 30S ribosome-binding factor RbfA [Clostridia bacterium]
MSQKRMERANSKIANTIFEILRDIRDPRISESFITVCSVKASPDFRHAIVFVSIMENGEEIVSLLQKSAGFIKKELVQRLDMPHVPDLKFILDKGTVHSEKINQILETLVIPKLQEDITKEMNKNETE